jgi:CarboxypepD_reg-like domain/Carboxypeptidase regulatory-like domain
MIRTNTSHKRSFLITVFFLLSISCLAQEKVTVIGKVTDRKTSSPLPNVHVYFNNTTLGSVTDSLGRYRITNVPLDLKELIASSVGYTSLRATLNLQAQKIATVDFKLATDNKLMASIVVQAKPDINSENWNYRLKLFRKVFIGENANANHTEILNPYVLSFNGDTRDTFTATADGPLEIVNKALGYKLVVNLKEFDSSPTSYKILMDTKFDTLSPKGLKEKERWQQNRITTYKGSTRHLFKSLMEGRSEEEGFKIYNSSIIFDVAFNKVVLNQSEVPALTSDIYVDTTKSNFKVFRTGTYQINYVNKFIPKEKRSFPEYPFPVSWITVSDSSLTLGSNGQPLKPTGFSRMGYMDSYRVADMLPFDYDPVKEEGNFILSKQIDLLSIRGTVKDENNKPLSEVEVFVNNGLAHTTTNRWGQFEIPNLAPGRYPIAFADRESKNELRIVDLSKGENTEIEIQLKPKTYFNFNVDPTLNYDFEKGLLHEKIAHGLPGHTVITNPEFLLFKHSKKRIDIKSVSPLIIENIKLGYRWKYFIDSAVMLKQKGRYRLYITGLVKMDTLAPKSRRQLYRYQSNRYDEYRGSWNNFTRSLIEGRTKDEGFKAYQVKNSVRVRKARFKKLTNEDISLLNPDSLLVVHDERLTLSIPQGLEIHNGNKRAEKKFYKGLSEQVLRVESDSSRVPISANGVISSGDLHIAGVTHELLKSVPVDYTLPYQKVTDRGVLVFIKESNLKAVKENLEKAYVQTDRSYYYAGDTIWMKSYLNYSNHQLRDSLSTVFYVELMDPQNKVISNRILRIVEGQASGDFALPISLPAGDYYLRAYTNWMRNFDEFFVRPLPVLARENFIVSQASDTTSLAESINIRLASDKSAYHTREPVELFLHLANDQGPALASFSVSVTDEATVANINGIPTIKSLKNPFKADGSKMIRLKYGLENSISFGGKIRNGREDEPYTVTAVIEDKRAFVKKINGEKFRLTIDFNDTTTALIQITDRSGSFVNSDIEEKEPIGFFIPPAPLTYELQNNSSYTRAPVYLDKNVRLLKEIYINAKRIVPYESHLNASIATRFTPYSYRTIIIEGKDILPIRQQNITTTLSRLVPYLNYSASTNLVAPRGVISGPNLAINNATGATYSRSYLFFVNGQPTELIDVLNMNTFSISRIEIYNSHISFGAVAIYTENYVPLDFRNFDKYLLRGYDLPLEFKASDARKNIPDYHPTLYWNPLLKTDTNGDATIRFRTSDVTGNLRVTIEGVTTTGEVFRKVMLLNVID